MPGKTCYFTVDSGCPTTELAPSNILSVPAAVGDNILTSCQSHAFSHLSRLISFFFCSILDGLVGIKRKLHNMSNLTAY